MHATADEYEHEQEYPPGTPPVIVIGRTDGSEDLHEGVSEDDVSEEVDLTAAGIGIGIGADEADEEEYPDPDATLAAAEDGRGGARRLEGVREHPLQLDVRSPWERGGGEDKDGDGDFDEDGDLGRRRRRFSLEAVKAARVHEFGTKPRRYVRPLSLSLPFFRALSHASGH